MRRSRTSACARPGESTSRSSTRTTRGSPKLSRQNGDSRFLSDRRDGVRADVALYSGDGETADEPREFPLEADRVIDPPHLLRWLLQRHAIPAMGSVLARRQAVLSYVVGSRTSFRTLFEDRSSTSRCSSGTRSRLERMLGPLPKEPRLLLRGRRGAGRVHRARPAFLEFAEGYLLRGRCRDAEIWSLLRRELRGLPARSRGTARPVVERLVASGHPRRFLTACSTAVATARAAARAGLTAAMTHRHVRAERLTRAAERRDEPSSGSPRAVTATRRVLTRARRLALPARLAAEYERDPHQDPARWSVSASSRRSACARLVSSTTCSSCIARRSRTRTGFRFFFGTYPWRLDGERRARGGNPFATTSTRSRSADRDLYGYRPTRCTRALAMTTAPVEWRRTVEIYRSLRNRYRPSL